MSAKNVARTSKARTPAPIVLTAVVIIIALAFTTVGALLLSQTIFSTGTITTVNIEVYSDSECTQKLTSINWGQTAPGENVSTTIYVKNTGNTPVTLSMTTDSWNPQAAHSYITLTWNKSGISLPAGNSTAAVLTITVASNITGITSYSLNIIITGTN